MKKIASIIIIVLFLQGCFTGWSKEDRNLYLFFSATHSIDTLQTREILDNPNRSEMNPILKNMSPNEATITMLAGLGLVYLVADLLPEKYRTPFLFGSTAISVWGVANNFSHGVQFKF